MEEQFIRQGEENWRDVVSRIAGRYGLEAECLEYYDDHLASNAKYYGEESAEKRTAWEALYEWDCLPLAAIVGPGGGCVL